MFFKIIVSFYLFAMALANPSNEDEIDMHNNVFEKITIEKPKIIFLLKELVRHSDKISCPCQWHRSKFFTYKKTMFDCFNSLPFHERIVFLNTMTAANNENYDSFIKEIVSFCASKPWSVMKCSSCEDHSFDHLIKYCLKNPDTILMISISQINVINKVVSNGIKPVLYKCGVIERSTKDALEKLYRNNKVIFFQDMKQIIGAL